MLGTALRVPSVPETSAKVVESKPRRRPTRARYGYRVNVKRWLELTRSHALESDTEIADFLDLDRTCVRKLALAGRDGLSTHVVHASTMACIQLKFRRTPRDLFIPMNTELHEAAV